MLEQLSHCVRRLHYEKRQQDTDSFLAIVGAGCPLKTHRLGIVSHRHQEGSKGGWPYLYENYELPVRRSTNRG